MSIPKIHAVLEQLEHEHNIRILYACELGSRVWGFSSPNSDYDIRFIYVRRPEDYLLIQPKKDTITTFAENNTLDLVGWDLRKVLHELSKSSMAIFEWIHSPTIYRRSDLHADLVLQSSQWFSSIRAEYYYKNLVKTNVVRYTNNKDAVIWKKYFTVIRLILAAMWIEQYKVPPPYSIDALLTILPEAESDMVDVIQGLVVALSSNLYNHVLVGPAIKSIHEFTDRYLNGQLGGTYTLPEVIPHNVDISQLDAIAAKYILEK